MLTEMKSFNKIKEGSICASTVLRFVGWKQSRLNRMAIIISFKIFSINQSRGLSTRTCVKSNQFIPCSYSSEVEDVRWDVMAASSRSRGG